MTMAGKRAEIAAALDTVPDVQGYTKRPGAMSTGDAWPQWRGSERDDISGQFVRTWVALVQLPADDVAADVWVDAHEDALWAALERVGWITDFQPVDLGATDGRPAIHGLMITMRSE